MARVFILSVAEGIDEDASVVVVLVGRISSSELNWEEEEE